MERGFRPYLTYREYQELGGSADEQSFNLTLRKAQRWLDHFTFNRIQKFVHIPEAVKEVLTEYIDRLKMLDHQRESGDIISKYSNGVETIEYKLKTEEQTKKELYQIALNWLPECLLYRQVNFDVEQYLQSKNHNPE